MCQTVAINSCDQGGNKEYWDSGPQTNRFKQCFFFRFIVPDSSDISADAIKSAAKAVGSINDAGCLPKSFFFVQIGSLFISSPPSPVYSSQLYLGKVALSAIGWNQKGSCINYD